MTTDGDNGGGDEQERRKPGAMMGAFTAIGAGVGAALFAATGEPGG